MLPALVNIIKEKPLLRRSISPASSSSERALSAAGTVCFSSCCSRSRKSFCSQWTRKRVSPVGRLCSSQPKGTSRASRPVAQS